MSNENKKTVPKEPKLVVEKIEPVPSPQSDLVQVTEVKTFDSNALAKEHGYDIHEAAKLFSMLEGKEIEALANDIKNNGQRVPIATQNKVIVDGRNRLVACKIAGVEPKFVEIEGDAVEAVISLNLQRRNLDESQKSTLALRLIPKLREEAKLRQQEGRVNDPRRGGGKASEEAAKIVGVSPRIVERLVRIEKYAPQEIAKIENGERTVGEVDKELSSNINHVKANAKDEWAMVEKGEKTFLEVYNEVLAKHPKDETTTTDTKKRAMLILASDDVNSVAELVKKMPSLPLLEGKFEHFAFYPDEKVDAKAAAPFIAQVEQYAKGLKR
jgi:ParB-like chromosome segregation protein Spo0J